MDPVVQQLDRRALLAPEDREKVLWSWNQRDGYYAQERTIHELISAQAHLTPQKIAVTFENRSLTFAELERQSNQLANYLQRHGVGAETLVGLYVHRSLEMVVGLLGILKAGGAYIPIDPDFPAARIKLILELLNQLPPRCLLLDPRIWPMSCIHPDQQACLKAC
jgi:non-ribosomal peptide synthetase component F